MTNYTENAVACDFIDIDSSFPYNETVGSFTNNLYNPKGGEEV
jgi:hypothetical protein